MTIERNFTKTPSFNIRKERVLKNIDNRYLSIHLSPKKLKMLKGLDDFLGYAKNLDFQGMRKSFNHHNLVGHEYYFMEAHVNRLKKSGILQQLNIELDHRFNKFQLKCELNDTSIVFICHKNPN